MTLQKSEADYSPTTMYRDYAISPTLFHWETQSRTSVASPTGQRYINHARQGSNILLFAREHKVYEFGTAPYLFLGTATLREPHRRPPDRHHLAARPPDAHRRLCRFVGRGVNAAPLASQQANGRTQRSGAEGSVHWSKMPYACCHQRDMLEFPAPLRRGSNRSDVSLSRRGGTGSSDEIPTLPAIAVCDAPAAVSNTICARWASPDRIDAEWGQTGTTPSSQHHKEPTPQPGRFATQQPPRNTAANGSNSRGTRTRCFVATTALSSPPPPPRSHNKKRVLTVRTSGGMFLPNN